MNAVHPRPGFFQNPEQNFETICRLPNLTFNSAQPFEAAVSDGGEAAASGPFIS